jgi:AI-2 transport system ATP-binding protein
MLPEGTEITHFSDETGAPREDSDGEILLEVRGLSGEQFQDVSLRVRAGEVVGLAGLVGAGRTELARAIVGLDAASAGEVIICGNPAPVRSPHTVQEMGLSYVPEDRHSHGIFLGLPNLHTMSAGILHRLGQPLLSSGKERAVGARFTQTLRIKSSGLAQPGRTLSGGNQQKTVLAKCLAGAPRVLILDEPTRGIDVQARLDVYNLIHELAEQGMAVLLISSDFEEIVHLSDRVLIMYHGRLTGELSRAQCKIDLITAGAFGIKEGLDT